jgi:oxygen-independent coproporphyrinogen-3 oxidase
MNHGIYVHLPICRSRCIYCDFYSQTDLSVEKKLVDSIITEIELVQAQHPNFRPSTIYLGGGTPSCFRMDNLSNIIDRIRTLFKAGAGGIPEITIEANPDDITRDLPMKYRDLGINRISLGTQSFINSELSFLGRGHKAEQNFRAIEAIKKAGFDNFSLDLIFAVPGQSLMDFKRSLEITLKHEPVHISLYCLTYENGTRLHDLLESGKINPLPDQEQADMFRTAIGMLRDAGFLQYEISNFAKPGFECLHNMNYWKMGDYLGLGPSAHSHMKNRRWANHADVRLYIDSLDSGNVPRSFEETLPGERIAEEYLMLSLRLREGIDLERYRKLAGRDLLDHRANIIDALIKKKLAELHGKYLRLTIEGILVADEITANLI